MGHKPSLCFYIYGSFAFRGRNFHVLDELRQVRLRGMITLIDNMNGNNLSAHVCVLAQGRQATKSTGLGTAQEHSRKFHFTHGTMYCYLQSLRVLSKPHETSDGWLLLWSLKSRSIPETGPSCPCNVVSWVQRRVFHTLMVPSNEHDAKNSPPPALAFE